jgi:hypothetical protein
MTAPAPKKGKKEVAEIAPSSDIVPDTVPKSMTFAEVMAWNRANADKLPPTPEPERKKRQRVKNF